jgi:hypothetical protein
MMRCRYEIEVKAQCPVNPDDRDVYAFTITRDAREFPADAALPLGR